MRWELRSLLHSLLCQIQRQTIAHGRQKFPFQLVVSPSDVNDIFHVYIQKSFGSNEPRLIKSASNRRLNKGAFEFIRAQVTADRRCVTSRTSASPPFPSGERFMSRLLSLKKQNKKKPQNFDILSPSSPVWPLFIFPVLLLSSYGGHARLSYFKSCLTWIFAWNSSKWTLAHTVLWSAKITNSYWVTICKNCLTMNKNL